MTTTPTERRGAVGTAHTRVEGRDKVTGAARYAGEVPFAGLVHGWMALSTVAQVRPAIGPTSRQGSMGTCST